jgi:hypothetical protein
MWLRDLNGARSNDSKIAQRLSLIVDRRNSLFRSRAQAISNSGSTQLSSAARARQADHAGKVITASM